MIGTEGDMNDFDERRIALERRAARGDAAAAMLIRAEDQARLTAAEERKADIAARIQGNRVEPQGRTSGSMREIGLMSMALGSDAVDVMQGLAQRDVARSNVLPVDGSENPEIAAMGIRCGPQVEGDELFRYATLPDGWKIERSQESGYGSYVVDERGRKRVTIFYKAAFYDRSAFMYPHHHQRTWVAKSGTRYVRRFPWHAGSASPVEFAASQDCAHRWSSKAAAEKELAENVRGYGKVEDARLVVLTRPDDDLYADLGLEPIGQDDVEQEPERTRGQ